MTYINGDDVLRSSVGGVTVVDLLQSRVVPVTFG